jgi:hypothetical protein
MPVQFVPKSVVSVSDMARLLGFSRSRLYQLIEEGVFPMPVYDVVTCRPFFDEDMQAVCMEVRRRNCGLNGRPVLFYAQRRPLAVSTKPIRKTTTKKPDPSRHADLLDGLRALGLASVKAGKVDAAVKQLFPRGTHNRDAGEVIRAVFLHVKRQDSSDKVGR